MSVAEPKFGDLEHAHRIRATTYADTTPMATIEAHHPERIEKREGLCYQSGGVKEEDSAPLRDAPKQTKRGKQPSKLLKGREKP